MSDQELTPTPGVTTTMVKVRFTCPGFHNWVDAPACRSYLSKTHRHLFHFQVEAKVGHEDRDVEFHDLLEEAKAGLYNMYDSWSSVEFVADFGGRSCEMIARDVLEFMREQGVVAVEVWEDGECGARVEVRGWNS